jgi:hypothetical protein
VLFPEDSADADILGDARFLVLNEPTHALQPEFLQRTIPYFFELYKTKRCVLLLLLSVLWAVMQGRKDDDEMGQRGHGRRTWHGGSYDLRGGGMM